MGLRRRGFSSTCAPKGPRPGGWVRRRLGFSGCGSRWGRKILRLRGPSVDLQPSERSIGGRSTTEGARRRRGSPFSWTVPREGRSAAHPDAKGTQDSSFARRRSNASALVTGSRRKRRSLGVPTHERRFLCPTEATAREPEPPPAQPPGRGLSETTPSANRGSAPARRDPPEAAHQQDETPAAAHQHDETHRGSAPAGRDPPQTAPQPGARRTKHAGVSVGTAV